MLRISQKGPGAGAWRGGVANGLLLQPLIWTITRPLQSFTLSKGGPAVACVMAESPDLQLQNNFSMTD
ncbi:hypothetical protein V6N13_119808 [Hibiscus sabdariffa]